MSETNSTQQEDSNEKLGWGKTLLICLLILAVGGGLIGLVFYTEPGTSRGGRPEPGATVVETVKASRGTYRPRIEAMGTVKAARSVNLQPRVSGQVIKRYDSFRAGGFVEQGDTLIKIDPRDYRNTLAQRRSAFRKARSQLEIELGQQEVAREEFQLLDEKISSENKNLVLRKPQLKSSRASLQSARAALKQARLDLARTSVEAPFDAHILSRAVSRGSQVSPGTNLGRLVGVDKYWVDVKVPVAKLRRLKVPESSDATGSAARIYDRSAWGEGKFRTGRVARFIGELGEKSRLATVRLSVRDPLGRVSTTADSPALVIGSYVRTEIIGRPLENTVRLKREYVRKGNQAWLLKDGKLALQPVEVVYRDPDYAYLSSGLSGGEHVVTSSLSTVVEGMKLKRKSSSEAGERGPSDETDADSGGNE